MTPLGHAVVNGLHIPVTGVSLRQGMVVFQCTLAGPVAPMDGAAVTIFGEDGRGICQGNCDDVRWRRVLQGESLLLEIRMIMDRCYGDADART